mmetsp:Transcript_42588/g.76545  ORF Transcript_42588/g.76545 Transcript_42588/m.76545 type:complete len:288 (-) Transcript_42588:1087-1950(-)
MEGGVVRQRRWDEVCAADLASSSDAKAIIHNILARAYVTHFHKAGFVEHNQFGSACGATTGGHKPRVCKTVRQGFRGKEWARIITFPHTLKVLVQLHVRVFLARHANYYTRVCKTHDVIPFLEGQIAADIVWRGTQFPDCKANNDKLRTTGQTDSDILISRHLEEDVRPCQLVALQVQLLEGHVARINTRTSSGEANIIALPSCNARESAANGHEAEAISGRRHGQHLFLSCRKLLWLERSWDGRCLDQSCRLCYSLNNGGIGSATTLTHREEPISTSSSFELANQI